MEGDEGAAKRLHPTKSYGQLYLGERCKESRLEERRYVIVHEPSWAPALPLVIDYVTLDYLRGYVLGSTNWLNKNGELHLGIPSRYLDAFENPQEIRVLSRRSLDGLRKDKDLLALYPDLFGTAAATRTRARD